MNRDTKPNTLEYLLPIIGFNHYEKRINDILYGMSARDEEEVIEDIQEGITRIMFSHAGIILGGGLALYEIATRI